MKQVELVIFDMDGLIFNTEDLAYEALVKAMQAFDKNISIDLYKQMIGLGSSDTQEILQAAYGPDFPITEVFKSFRLIFHEIIENGKLQLKPGVLELLDFLDKRKIKKCIASSSKRKTIEKYLTLTHLTSRFDFYVSGEEVENGKPAPDIFIEACKRADEERQNAIVLEDSYNGLLAAHRANIDCYLIPDMIEANEEMKEMARKVLPNLHEVARLLA